MSRRPRSSVFFNHQIRPQDNTTKPIELQINDFLDLFDIKLDPKLNLENKIQFLKKFLKSFLENFKKSQEKIEFCKQFSLNCEKISIILLLNIIQLESTQLRLLSLRLILYLSHIPDFNSKFQSLDINSYITRLIDLKLTTEDICLSIEYVRLLTQIYPQYLNKCLIFSLLALIEDPKNNINNFVIESLLEIATVRPKLACECKIYHSLFDYILNTSPDSDVIIEVIIQSLIKTCDDLECRKLINLKDLISLIISPLIDLNYTVLNISYSKESDQNQKEPKIEHFLNSSITAIYTFMKSFNGIMILCLNEGEIIRNLFSPLSWFLNSKKQNLNKNLIKNTKENERQILILNTLVDFLYKLFSVDKLSEDILTRKLTNRSISSSYYSFNLIDDDFVNQECDVLFESLDSFSSQSNLNLKLEHKISIYSTSPNLSITYKAFLLKLIAEMGLFETLLDLYFGLPVSFLQTYTPRPKSDTDSNNLIYKYEILSLKTLNLFAELYYMINIILFSEYCIDDFTQGDVNSSPYSSEKSVYNEMKKLSLVSYMRELNAPEREKEVIMFITELSSKKEMLKNGLQVQTDMLSGLGFFSQQFLANSGFLSSKKFQAENEIVNSQIDEAVLGENLVSRSLSFFSRLFSKNEDYSNLEGQISRQIDLTLTLQLETNLSQNLLDQKVTWNWYEIVKFFEIYLLTKSSFHPRFTPSQYAYDLNGNNSKNLANNKIFQKFFQKLCQYFIYIDKVPNKERIKRAKTSVSISQTINQFDSIACTGCYLIDFSLNNSEQDIKFLNELVKSIKSFITKEFDNETPETISKDHPLSLYILLLGHLTSSEQGDKILENLKIYDFLLELIETSHSIALMKLILSTFNFYVSIKSRLILTKCLCLTSIYTQSNRELIFQYNDFKIYALKLILNLFRANNLKFEVFYVEAIFKSLYSFKEVLHSPGDVQDSIEFLIDFKLTQIKYYFNLRPDFVEKFLDHINSLEDMLHNSLVSKCFNLKVKLIFLIFRLKLDYLNIKNLNNEQIDKLISQWYEENLDKLYFKLIERNLFDYHALNPGFSHEIDDRQDYDCIDEEIHQDSQVFKNSIKIYRRINDLTKNNSHFLAYQSQIYLPFHLNTALARIVDKVNFKSTLLDERTLEQLKFLKSSINEQTKNVKKLKSVLWSLASICICEEGFKYVSKLIRPLFKNLFDFVCCLIKLAENHSNLSVRSTCFICLNLMSKSCTGANLIGKLGWHTFQPSRFTPTRLFYSLLSSMSKEQQELSVYSSIDTAIILYNLNRAKSTRGLKLIKKYFDCDLSNYEIDYLNGRNMINLENLEDKEFIKIFDKNKVGFNFENLTVPVRISLMSIENFQHVDNYVVNEKKNGFFCENLNCLKCYMKRQGLISNEYEEKNEKIILEIMEKLDGIVPLIEFEELYKIRVKRLFELKKISPSSFDICLYSYFVLNYMSIFKLKYKLRKIVQDLFNDINFLS